jgi:OOP family OmpA-OmpF porin
MDNNDSCLATPVGEQVDERGCSASQRDTDRDGVKDNADRCPNTPSGEKVNGQGCSPNQLDKDLDKVPDTADKCADTPAGQEVDENGCSAGQRDVDGDGVMDDADKCLDSAPGEAVDPAGCARDTDADGISDGRDKCPGTPTGQAVDENGCPQLFQGAERSVILQGVNFTTGKSELTEASKAILVEVARSLAASPGTRVEVSGYTDNTGSGKTNLKLSQQRAESVEAFLVQNGASPAQVSAKGYGEENPVADNKTKAGRAQNRRVELHRLD